MFLGGGIPRGATMAGAKRKFFLKIEDSRSLEMAISEFYQGLFTPPAVGEAEF